MNDFLEALLASSPITTISDQSVLKGHKALKSLTMDGTELNATLSCRDTIIYMEFTSDGKATEMPLPKKVLPFLINYLLSGYNTVYPKDGGLNQDMCSTDDLYDHIKRACDKGTAECEEVSETEVHVKATYPYGSIDFGTLPISKSDLIAKLASIPDPIIVYEERDLPDLNSAELPTERIEVEKGRTLSDIFPDGIPTNTIVDKTVCGIGATYLEINSDRPSIIIEPNIPVIEGKKKSHDHIITVYGEKIKEADIISQIQSCTGHVKIMTTPDSYRKVAKAVEAVTPDYRRKYFLLFDECEKIVSDIDYRPNMALPIDDFFRFKDKAMVSATPIIVNDPRFSKQGFKVIKIIPQYDYRYTLELKPTNNVSAMVRKTIDRLDESETVCFFYNSVKGIVEIIDMLGISDKSNIYCSTEASKELKKERYNVYDTVTDELNRYNFFTSRFYSAVDIKVDVKPTVIMLTQVYKKSGNDTPYSFIDPETEAIQIAGRFRNGINRLIHITNTDEAIDYIAKEEAEQILNAWHKGHMKLKELYDSTEDEYEQGYICQAIKRTDYFSNGYVGFNGEINYFRYNNAYLDHRLELIYRYPAVLYKSYRKSGLFNVTSKAEYAIYTDEEKRKLDAKNTPKAERIKLIHEILSRRTDDDNEYDRIFVDELIAKFATDAEALMTIGYSEIKRLNYDDNAVRLAVRKYRFIEKVKSEEVRNAVYKVFSENTIYDTSYIIEQLRIIFTEYEVDYIGQLKGGYIRFFFKAVEVRTTAKRQWELFDRL